jgi:ferredoxin
MPIAAPNYRLRVNPVACDAFGYCAELLPEIVLRDEWGYPILKEGPIPPRLFDLAQRAVRECPRRALLIEEVPRPRDEVPTARTSRPRTRTN